MNERILITFAPNSQIQEGMAYDIFDAIKSLNYDCLMFDFRKDFKASLFSEKNEFENLLDRYSPTILFTFNDWVVQDLLCNKKNFKIISWFVDKPSIFIDNIRALIRQSSNYHAFVFDKYYLKSMKDSGFINSASLPLATNYNRFSNTVVTETDKIKYDYDIAFVGGYSKLRWDTILEIPKKYKIGIWGEEKWNEIKRENITYNGFIDYLTEIPKLYKTARIILNVSTSQLKTTLNNRIYDVSAAGGFIITDFQEDINTLFNEGDLIYYNDIEDLKSKIEYYISNENERKIIINKTRNVVLKNHTYNNRILETFEIIKNNEKNNRNLYFNFKLLLNKIDENLLNKDISKLNFYLEQVRNYEKWNFLLFLGKVFINNNEYKKAHEYLKLSLQYSSDKNKGEIYCAIGSLNLKENDFLKAKDHFLTALQFLPNNTLILNYLAQTLSKLNHKNEAIMQLDKILVSTPEDEDTLYNKFSILFEMKRY
ncbi:MAG: hypothetical protein ACD_79C00736G0003, partial [uncultured bacterium]